MKKTIIVLCLFAVFLLVMIPTISSIENSTIKENTSRILKHHKSTICSILDDFLHKQYGKTCISEKEGLSASLFVDPGNGTDGNGPDDITDWIYLLIFFVTLPVSFPLLFIDIIFIIVKVIAISLFLIIPFFIFMLALALFPITIILIINYYLYPELYEDTIENINSFFNVLNTIIEITAPDWFFFPLILIGEFSDTIDYDNDGR